MKGVNLYIRVPFFLNCHVSLHVTFNSEDTEVKDQAKGSVKKKNDLRRSLPDPYIHIFKRRFFCALYMS